MSVMYGEMDSSLIRSRADSDGSTALDKDYSLGLNFLEVPGNDKCADCSSSRPNWASINLGIMVCIKCSGTHRSLGVHISKVRSVTLDDWEPEVQKVIILADRETFIKAKYVDHAFVHPHPDFTRREVVRPLPRRSVSPRFPSQFARPISTASAEGMVVGEDAKSQSLSETSSLSSVDPTLLLMAQNLMRVQGKFGGKIISKAKGWKASLEKGSPIVGRKEMGGGREDAVGEMTVVEEGEQVATNHLPLRKDLDDLERKGIPFERSSSHPGGKVPLTVQTGESTHGLPAMDANLPCRYPPTRTQTPSKDGSTQTPPKDGSTQTPPKEGSTQTPPKEGSTQTPPKEGSTQTHPKGKEVHGRVSDSPMPPDLSVVQVVPIPHSPRECATGPNFPFVQSPGVKRARPPPRLLRGVFRGQTPPLTVELLGSVPAASSSLTKLSDSEDVFEDRSAFPPSGGNHPSGGNRPSEDTASLVSSFSVQDLQDIFKGHIPVPTLRIHSVDDSMIPNGPPDGSKKSPSKSGIHSRLSQSTLDMTSLDGESGVLESNSLERSPSVGTQPPEVEVVVVPDPVHPDVFLFDAAHNGNLPAALCALAHGANANYVNDCMTPMLEAVDTGNTTMTEFLYQNGGKLDVCDMSMKRGCLHHAVFKDDASMVVLLLKKCAPASATDVDGKDALALALERQNVNIVMLLKVTKLKADNQKKNNDPQLEETVAEVYKDIEVVTTAEPEKLKKLNGLDSYSTTSHDN
ncbi:hypothetical protein EMCRGX_G016484 [Ephydatia muelleri]